MRSMGFLDIGFLGGIGVTAGFFIAAYFALKRLLAHLEQHQPSSFNNLGRPEMSGPPVWVTEPVAVRKFLTSRAYEDLHDPVLSSMCARTKQYLLASIVGFVIFLLFGFAIIQTT